LDCRKKGKIHWKGKGCQQKGRQKRRKTNHLLLDRDQLQAQLDGVAGVVTQLQTTLDHANTLYNCVKPHFATPINIIQGAEIFISVLQGLLEEGNCRQSQLAYELSQATTDLVDITAERDDALGEHHDAIRECNMLQTKLETAMAEQACLRKALEEHSIAAEAARQLVAELAPGLADYNIITCGDENQEHAHMVVKGKQFNEMVACKHDGYLPLPQGSVCLLNKCASILQATVEEAGINVSVFSPSLSARLVLWRASTRGLSQMPSSSWVAGVAPTRSSTTTSHVQCWRCTQISSLTLGLVTTAQVAVPVKHRVFRTLW